MPKRDTEIEPIDEAPAETAVPTVGERLRAAREARGLALEDLAAQTRIPQRHLESIENADWDALPAPTYTTGFAKSYASAVGLDRTEIGDQLRAEMGGQRFIPSAAEAFEPADPRRTMPKGLVIGTILGLIVLVALMSWLNQRSLDAPDDSTNASSVGQSGTPASTVASPQASTPTETGQPVVLSATGPVWVQVSEKGGATLFSGMLQPGQNYLVPASATAPVLKTGKPEALQAKVGNQVAPPLGPAATTVNNVSLLAADLMKPAAAPASSAVEAAVPAQQRAPARTRSRPPAIQPAPAPQASDTGPATTNAQ